MISYFIIYLLIEFFSIFIYKKRINIIETFINVSIIFIPLILFSLIYLLDILLGYFLHNLFQGWILKALFLLFQIWSVILLLNVIKVTKGLSLEKSSFIVLIIIYINLELNIRSINLNIIQIFHSIFLRLLKHKLYKLHW